MRDRELFKMQLVFTTRMTKRATVNICITLLLNNGTHAHITGNLSGGIDLHRNITNKLLCIIL